MNTLLRATLLAGCLTALASHAGTVTDTFGQAHDYLTQGVTGTIWDGIYTGAGQIPGGSAGGGDGATSVLSANTNALTITSTQTEWENGNNDGVLLFKLVYGDFDASVHIDSHQVIDYHHSGLLARLPDLTEGAAGEDNVSWTRFDEFGIANYFRTEVGGVTQMRPLSEVNANYWLRLQRVGDTFFAYEKENAGDEWVLRDQQDRPDMTGLPVQVGLMQALYSANSGTAKFSSFSLSGDNVNSGTYPSPATGLTAATNSPGTVTLSWTPGAGSGGSIVVVRAGGPLFRQPSDMTSYMADASFGSGDDLGVGDYAVYIGSGSSVTISNLPGGATLSAAVFAFNGTSYSHTTPATVTFASPAMLNSISLTTTTPILFGGQGQATVWANFDNGSSNTVSALATYTATPSGIVTVNATGVITPVANGSASVVASYNGLFATNSVTVTNLGSATLVHRYSFNETSGETAVDSVGAANGTLHDGAAFDGSGAVQLDGTAAYVDLPNGILTNFTSITVEAWFTDTGSATWARLFDFGNSADGEDTQTGGTSYMFLSVPVNANFRAVYGNPGEQIMEAPRPPASQKVHVVWTSEGPGHYGRLYVDGHLVASNNAMTLTPASLGVTLNNWIGKSQYPDPFFLGSVDEFRMWKGSLSPLQVAASTAAGPGMTVTDPGILQSVTVSVASTLAIGAGTTAKALGNFANVSSVPLADQPGLAFSSSDPAILEVTAAGDVTAVGPGTASIIASYGGKSGMASITVSLPQTSGTYAATLAALAPDILLHLDETTPAPAPNVATNKGTLGFAGSGSFVGSPFQQTPGALVGSDNTSVTIASGGQYVSVPYSSGLGVKPPFTVEGWLNPATTLTGGALTCALSCGHLGDPRDGWLIYQGDTGWNFRTYNTNGLATAISITGGGVPTAGTWYHVVATYDGTNANLYVNGVLAGTGSSTSYVPNSDGAFTIGIRSDLAFQWAGTADEVALYTNALTGAEVSAHYANGTSSSPATPYDQLVLAKAPVVYLRLDDVADTSTPPAAFNSGSTLSANDGFYEGGVTVAGTGVPLPGLGAANKAPTFNGIAGGVLSFASPLNDLAQFSMLGWFKPAGTGAQAPRTGLIGQNDAIEFYYDSANVIGLYTAGGGQFISANVAGKIVPNGWNLVAAVGDGTNIFIYLNGRQIAKGGSAVTSYGSSASPFNVGAAVADASGGVYNGQIDEVSVFTTKALTATDIAALYYSAGQKPAFVTQPTAPASALPLGSTYTLTSTVAGSPVLGYQWWKDGSSLSGKTLSSLTLSNVDALAAGGYSVVVTNSFGAVTSSIVNISIEASALEISIGLSGDDVLLTWPSGSLESADEAAGPYIPVNGATSPWTVSPTAPRKFYRLSQ